MVCDSCLHCLTISTSMLSISSSSSSVSSDSDVGGNSLNASQWNKLLAQKPIQPRPRLTNNFDNDLVKGRRYSHPTLLENDNDRNDEVNFDNDNCNDKSELETAVLVDALSRHFLYTNHTNNEIQSICNSLFVKCTYKNHEVIYSKGDDANYMFILYSGEILQQDNKRSSSEMSTTTDKYTFLGELSVLTGQTYQETVKVISDSCTLFRLDGTSLHRSLRQVPKITTQECISLLQQSIPNEMKTYLTEYDIEQLSKQLTIHTFDKGDVLVKKNDQLDSLVFIVKGLVRANNVTFGGHTYDDQLFGPDEDSLSFGWQSILSASSAAAANNSFKGEIVAQTDGVALILSRTDLVNIISIHHKDSASVLEHIAERRLARLELEQLPVFQDSELDLSQINQLVDKLHRFEYSNEETIFRAGEKVTAALYFVREGTVTLEMNKGQDCRVVESGGYFGEGNMLRNQNRDGMNHFVIRSPMTAVARGPRVRIDVLYLEEIRSVVNTSRLGLEKSHIIEKDFTQIQLDDIQRHSLLGSGAFGQVWLASIPIQKPITAQEEKKSNNDGTPRTRTVALKIQSKYQVVESGEAHRVVAERNILASLKSPFLLHLYNSFQDECLLYMITTVVLGGELESLIPDEGMCETTAKFYAAGVLEGLAAMHRHHLVHRDIKPTNVLINEKGYPVLIDMGFAKYIPDKSYTFIGSPIFTAPEIIRAQGHNRVADYWSWGILVYRLVTGKYPFYQTNLSEMELYKRICNASLELDGKMSMEFRLLAAMIIYPDPKHRLGSKRNGWRDIFNHGWFTSDGSFNFHKLRMQKMTAPWVPELHDPLDASSFHSDESEVEDLLLQSFPNVSDKSQKIFASFGHRIKGSRC